MPRLTPYRIQYRIKKKPKKPFDPEKPKLKPWYKTWCKHLVDLKGLGLEYDTNTAIFTRENLKRYRLVRDKILNDSNFFEHREPDLQGKERIVWKRRGFEDDTIEFGFMTAVELHPKMHVRKRRSDKLKLLYALNGRMKTQARNTGRPILTPVVIESWCQDDREETLHDKGLLDHEDAKSLEKWRKTIPTMRQAWSASPQLQALNTNIDNAIEDLVQVRKIVCFGLGTLRYKEHLTSGLNQHFFAFDIASRIDAAHTEQEGNVRILLQDPEYTPLDKLLLTEACIGRQLEFVCDPDGLLEIDEHTMVIGIYLPMCFPLLQICADIARPIAIITNRVETTTGKSRYSWQDQTSPRVARMLEMYKCFQELGGPYRLRDQEGTNQDDSNWLYQVQMWLRNNAAVEEEDTEMEDGN